MVRRLSDALPPSEELLQLEPEEIAIFLLDYLCELEGNKTKLSRYNFISGILQNFNAGEKNKEVAKAITEAWMWLEREIMVAPIPGEPTGGWFFVTRKGYRLREKTNFEAYKKGHFLPKENLDENLIKKVYPLFISGEYDTAVFQAFKEVEIRVRVKAGLSDEFFGLNLMRKAFNPENGTLTDMNAQPAERQATSNLFAGSIGLFKNPSSHRRADYNEPAEAAEVILFANYLLRIVDRCRLIRPDRTDD